MKLEDDFIHQALGIFRKAQHHCPLVHSLCPCWPQVDVGKLGYIRYTQHIHLHVSKLYVAGVSLVGSRLLYELPRLRFCPGDSIPRSWSPCTFRLKNTKTNLNPYGAYRRNKSLHISTQTGFHRGIFLQLQMRNLWVGPKATRALPVAWCEAALTWQVPIFVGGPRTHTDAREPLCRTVVNDFAHKNCLSWST